MSDHKSRVTSVRLAPELIEAVRRQGVGNMSSLVSGLLKDWLKDVESEDDAHAKNEAALRAQLEEVRQEWFAYVKQQEDEKQLHNL